MAADSDQQYFFMFWNVLERERFGPLHELPFEYNVKHYVLSQKQWTARAYLVFMSRPEQGHIRIVHFNRDKPWAGAQCGPFQHAFWHAASRAISGLSSSDASQLSIGGEHGLASFVREGMRHEDARPCIAGARSASVFCQPSASAKTKACQWTAVDYGKGGAIMAGLRQQAKEIDCDKSRCKPQN